jgi:hypothetical protein
MLVGTDNGAIHKMEQPVEPAIRIRLLLEGVKELLPDARPPPAIEAAGHRAPRTIPFWEIPPGGAGAEDPEDAVKDGTVVMGRAPNRWLLGWEQGLEPLPLLVRQIASVHTPQYTEES